MAMLMVVPALASAAPNQVDSFLGGATDQPGDAAGSFDGPAGVAVNNATGAVYVVDADNDRIQQFDASHEFVRAWGKDVVAGGGTGFEVCEAGVDTCQAGAPGSLGGELDGPRGIAVDQSDGSVYVTEQDNLRVQKFEADGTFVRAFGREVVVAGGAGDVPADPVLVNERQAVQLSEFFDFGCFCVRPLTGGTFTLTLGSETTAGIPHDASAGAVASALEALPSVGAGNVTVDLAVETGRTWTVEFTGALAGVDQPEMVGDPTALEPSGAGFLFVSTLENGATVPQGHAEICTNASECRAGIGGAAGGEFAPTFSGYPAVVPAGAPNAGNVLVADPGNFRVQEFSPTGAFVRTFGWDVAGPGGGAEDLGTGFEICSAAGAGAEDCTAAAPGDGSGQFGYGGPTRVAADSAGAIYTVDPEPNFRVQKFVPDAGSPGLAPSVFAPAVLSGDGSAPPTDVAVDVAGERVYVVKGIFLPSELRSERRVLELTYDGALQETHMANARIDVVNGLAYRSGSDRLYVSSTTGGHRVYVLDDDGAAPVIATVFAASNVGSTAATLRGEVGSNGPLATSYRLEYSRNGSSWTTATSGQVDGGNTVHPVTAAVTGLLPNTLYRVRIVTSKGFGSADVASAEETFLTDSVAPQVASVGVSSIEDTSATVSGYVNPQNTPTSYRFEYGEGSFSRRAPVPDAPVGSGATLTRVSQDLTGLRPGTTYQFRLVAISETEGTVASEAGTFTTRSGAAPREQRAFELVSPAYKVSGNGPGAPVDETGAGDPTAHVTGPTQAATAGNAAYVGERFAVSGHLGSILLDSPFATASDWALAERVDGQVGWRSHSPVTRAFKESEPYRMMQLQASSPDFSTLMWVGNAGDLPFFEEMVPMANIGNGASLISDWGNPPESPTRWEPIGPLEASQQVFPGGALSKAFMAPAISTDGSHIGVAGTLRGLAGSDDPTLDTPSPTPGIPFVAPTAKTAYLDDISAGLSDSWPGAGVRTPVAACTGEDDGSGQSRTRIPVRNGDGSLSEAPCAPRKANRSSRLVSDYGSVFAWIGGRRPTSTTNVVSSDGARAFFMAPDPAMGGGYEGATDCVNADAVTHCPTQLYVRQRNLDGEIVTRWISRPEPARLDGSLPAALLGPAYFEGASADGSKVFFHTATPLTADDPNGASQEPANPDPAGQRGATSWDLYMFELAPGPDGDPATPDGDPTGPGSELTRISAGPSGSADCSTQPLGFGMALRFSSQDARRVYFSCSAPLGGVADRATGTAAGAQGGTPEEAEQTNVYLYDAGQDRYTFVARIPRAVSASSETDEGLRSCASTAGLRGKSVFGPVRTADVDVVSNCWRGTDDGSFALFFTLGRLTADDPDELGPGASADVYAYDADSDELVRVSAPQGSVDETYPCMHPQADVTCYADPGMHMSNGEPDVAVPLLNVLPGSDGSDGRVIFFESESRLVDEDENSVFDVYQWRDGALSLISSGDSGSDGTTYKGNSADGRNVYLATRDKLTWQDVDAVLDVYTARIDGGIPEPTPPPVCAVLGDGCQGAGAGSVGTAPKTSASGPGEGNAPSAERKALSLTRLSAAQRRKAARSGRLALSIRASSAGRVSVAVRAKLGRRTVQVGRASKRVRKAGTVKVRVRLSSAARKRLRSTRSLRVTVKVSQPGARSRAMSVLLPGVRS